MVWLAVELAKRVSANAVLFITAAIGCALVIALTAAGAEIYDSVEDGEGLAGIDRPVLDGALGLRSGTADRLITWFTNLGGPVGMTIIATAITLAMVLRWRSRTPLVLMLIAVAGSLAMTHIGKVLVGRVRPPTIDAVPPFETSPSFPSGHALNSTVIAGLVAYLLLRRLTSHLARVLTVVLAAAWALAIGLSRGFPRPSLAHRRHVRLDARAGLARLDRHRAPAASDRSRRPARGGRRVNGFF